MLSSQTLTALSPCWTLRRKRTGASRGAPALNMTKKKQKNVLVRNIYRCAISTGYSKIKPGECAEVDAALAAGMLDAGFVGPGRLWSVLAAPDGVGSADQMILGMRLVMLVTD